MLKSTDEQEITDGLDLEILKVEKLRALIFAMIVLFFAIVFYLYTSTNLSVTKLGSRVPFGIGEVLLLSLVLFELLFWYILRHFLNAGKPVPIFWLYLVAFVE
ncbi:MAG: hypothetical protein ACK47R_24945, partial [Planctomycetia bacterium]